jgi:hypothetical protein
MNSLPFPSFPPPSKPSEQSSSANSESNYSSARTEARSEADGHRRRGYSSPTDSYSSSPPDSPQTAPPPPPASSGGDIEGLLSILVGQVRDLKDSIKGVQKELKAVNKRQKTFEDHHKQLKERVELLIPLIANQASQSSTDSTSPPSSSSSPDQMLPTKLTTHSHMPAIPFPLPRSMPRTRAELLDYFPLLKVYESLYSPDTPFVIDEFTYVIHSLSCSLCSPTHTYLLFVLLVA